MRTITFLCLAVGTLAISVCPAMAEIILDIVDPVQSPAMPGQTYDFHGTITNNTGGDFAISDLAFSFLGFDPSQISAFDPLPTGPTFVIPDDTTSPLVTLFDLTLDPSVSPNGTYQSDVIVSDPQGDFSNDVTVTITPVPEPATLWLLALAIGTGAIALGGRRRNKEDIR
jgi:hypothetical protein